MIERYTRPEMGKIWSLENKYALWQEIEVLACEAQAALGEEGCGITPDEAAYIRAHAGFSSARIAEIEREVNHDVIAFTTCMAEHIDAGLRADEPHPSRWVHFGMTSTDLGDTALACQMVQACDIVLAGVREVGQICRTRALELRDVVCVGRTHGVHAEPMTFGMKFGAWAWACKRAEQRLLAARSEVAVGEISGAIGTYSSIDPRIERYVCEHLGLACDPLSTQVVARDRHAALLSALAVTASTLESIATQIRLLQQTDIIEAEEPFSAGQKGSSAMPHKRNPVTAERICGLARVVKAAAQVSYDDVALWYERDISHSSAERVALSDAFTALDYMLAKMKNLVSGLQVYPARMQANLNRTRGLIYSSKVLLLLVEAGMTREDAYRVVQRCAMAVWDDIQNGREGEGAPDFAARILADECASRYISAADVERVCDPRTFLTNSGVIFERLQNLTF